MIDGEEGLGRAASGGQGDQSLNMSGKFDERMSLLPDGTRAEKNHDSSLVEG